VKKIELATVWFYQFPLPSFCKSEQVFELIIVGCLVLEIILDDVSRGLTVDRSTFSVQRSTVDVAADVIMSVTHTASDLQE
jgi:hypothetical protein